MTDPHAWLAARLAEAPESLRTHVSEALGSAALPADPARVADALRAAAERLAATASSATPATSPTPPSRALRLLAADTLITLACQWTAETQPEKLGEVV